LLFLTFSFIEWAVNRMNFEQSWAAFLERERKTASGRRLERLMADLSGEKKMFETVLWPVFRSFDGFSLEYEIKSTSGVSIFVDALYHPLRLAFESEGFVPHAENITRDRFAFERMRIRTLALYGYKYIPFSWDELDRKAEFCQRYLYEFLGRYTGSDDPSLRELTVYEREVLRYALRVNRPIQMRDVQFCLGVKKDAGRHVLKQLMAKRIIRPSGQGRQKIRAYVLDDRAHNYVL